MPQKLLRLWNEAAALIKNEIGLSAEPLPVENGSLEEVAEAFEREGHGPLARSLRHIIDDRQSIDAQVIWATLAWTLREEALCPEAVIDFGMGMVYYSRQTKEQMNAWMSLWKRMVPRRKVGPTLIYDPANLYESILHVRGKRGFRDIVKEIVLYGQNGADISLDEYVTVITKRYRRFSYQLAPIDAKIIQILLKTPGKTIPEIATELGYSTFWVSQRINKLKENHILFEFDHVPFSKIGIRMFNVLLKGQESEKDALHMVAESPFLYGYREVLAGDWDLLAIFCIPESWQVNKWLRRFEKLASEWRVSVTTSEIKRSGTSASFDYYDPYRNAWRIPWDALRLYSEELVGTKAPDDLEDVVELTPYGQRDVRLEDLDIRILAAIRARAKTLVEIRKKTRASQNKVAARLKILREKGFIVKRWEALHIGLVEGALIETADKKTGKMLMHLSTFLPRAIVSADQKSRLIAVVNLPEGGTYCLLNVLAPLRNKFTFAQLGDYIYGEWGFPTYPWNPKTQSWKVPMEEVARWLDGLR